MAASAVSCRGVDRGRAAMQKAFGIHGWEPVAQAVEHETFNLGAAGSNPAGLTNEINSLMDDLHAHARLAIA